MPLFCFISFEKGLQTLIFLQWWLHFRFALCMLSDPVHLDPLPHPPPFAGSRSNPRPPVDVLASPRSPLYPIQHPSPNALSSPSPPLDLCLMCSAQLCVYAMYIVWTLLSTPSRPPPTTTTISPSRIRIVSLSATWIYPDPLRSTWLSLFTSETGKARDRSCTEQRILVGPDWSEANVKLR